MDQITQRSCGFPIPGGVQGEVEWGFEEPDLVGGITHCPWQGDWN